MNLPQKISTFQSRLDIGLGRTRFDLIEETINALIDFLSPEVGENVKGIMVRHFDNPEKDYLISTPPQTTESKSYERDYSHFHCWLQDQPSACGIPLEKHTQCCLCDVKVQKEVTHTTSHPDHIGKADKMVNKETTDYHTMKKNAETLTPEQERQVQDIFKETPSEEWEKNLFEIFENYEVD